MTGGAVRSTRCVACDASGLDGDRFCEACGHRRNDPRDHVEIVLPDMAGVSDRGLRHVHNEDALAMRSLTRAGGRLVRLAVLCDGVSSAPRPDLASLAAADAALAALVDDLGDDGVFDPAAAIEGAAQVAASAVAQVRTWAQLPAPSACTFIAAAVVDHHATIGWVGDSRGYWLPGDGSSGTLLTVDDSWLVQTVRAGHMSAERAARDPRAHAITACLGAGLTTTEVHLTTLQPDAPGTLVLCTDGLWNDHDSPDAMAAALTVDAAADPLAAARQLVNAAIRRGGRDNITAVVIPIVTSPLGTSDSAEGAP